MHLLDAVPLYSTVLPQSVVLVKDTEENSSGERNVSSQLAVVSLSSPSPLFLAGCAGRFPEAAMTKSCHFSQEPASSSPACHYFANQTKEMRGGWRSAVISAEKKKSCCCRQRCQFDQTHSPFCSWSQSTRGELVDLGDQPATLLTSSSVTWGMKALLVI